MKTPLKQIAFIVLATCSTGVSVSACHRTDTPHDAEPRAQESAAPDAHSEHALHEDHGQHADAAPPTLSAGQRWPTDPPLREAMSRIRSAVEQSAPAYAQKRMQPADAKALAAAVQEDITYIVENCKLEPAADAAFHGLIGRMLGAAAALEADPESEAGLPQLEAVLQDYSASFDHPGWVRDAEP